MKFPAPTCCVLVVILLASPAVSQDKAHRRPQKLGERIERLFQAVILGKDLGEDAAENVLELTSLVDDDDPETCTLALRTLARLNVRAAPATGRICKRLNDPCDSIRGAAVDALVAIGESAVAPLQKLLTFSSPTTRAGSAQALCRLQKIAFGDLERLAKDPDPRVRAVAADGLSYVGKLGVAPLAALLLDPELAVGVEAARALQSNREDPSVAIPKLIDALPRSELGWAAARALAAYGVEARRAVPSLINSYPLGVENSFGWEDEAEEALKHIGPADERDALLLVPGLERKDPEARILAAKCLSLMGVQGKAAGQALEDAAESSLKEYLALQRRVAATDDDEPENSGRIFVVTEICVGAVWHVTRDARRFVDVIEKLVLAADCKIEFQDPTPWQEFSADDCRALERLVRHPNDNVRQTALIGLIDSGARADSLRGLLLEVARADDVAQSRLAIRALASCGPGAAAEVSPILISRFRDGKLPLEAVADTVQHLNIRLPEFQEILERGLQDPDRKVVSRCARALRVTSPEPRRVASLIIDGARQRGLDKRATAEILDGWDAAAEAAVPFLSQLTGDPDFWTRHDAINALGSFGRKATAAVDQLEPQLNDESRVIRLKAAKSLFLITGDAGPLDRELQATFTKEGREEYYFEAIRTIGELKQAGAKFVRYVVTELRSTEPDRADSLIAALESIGTDDAVSALEETARSPDWMLRSRAAAALRTIRAPDGKRGR
ncbi:MAG: HEAT repeat domain-containing protein [Planctomycetia bacterium]|nr:HEAT repeat domain-containing protein [Planctomycetia bacterium]